MKDEITSAMRRTLDAVRSGDLDGATRLIQESLSAKGTVRPTDAASDVASPAAHRLPPSPSFTVRPDATEAETVETAPARTLFERLRDQVSGAVDCAAPHLGQTLSHGLSQGLGHGLGRTAQAGTITPPKGSQWLSRHHAGPEGEREYRLFLPSCGGAAATGLLLMLHGCKQDPDDFARGTGMLRVADEAGLIVVFPAQTRQANMMSCWNWFEPGHQSAGTGEPAILAAIVRAVAGEFAVSPDHVFAAGLSAGGAMAAILAETHPALFAAIGVHSGLPTGAAQDAVSAFAAMDGRQKVGRAVAYADGPRLILFHGDADSTVRDTNADSLLGTHRPGGTRVEHATSPGGRRYTRTVMPGAQGTTRAESWRIGGAGHAWAGGSPNGSFTDPAGPDASREMVRFFLEG